MPLLELMAMLERGSIPRRAVAVTFDDGYADVLVNAIPELKTHDVPATVFAVSRSLVDQDEFWWDELARVLLGPGELPPVVELSLDELQARWTLADHAVYDEESFNRWRGWEPWTAPPPTSRQSVFLEAWIALQRLPDAELRRAIEEIRHWGSPQRQRSAHDRTVDAFGLRQLATEHVVDIGAHTVTHSALSALSPGEQRAEIEGSKVAIETAIGQSVRSFAYPYGRRQDYTAETVAFVRDAGYTCACANVHGVANVDTDPFQLPRIHVRDWDGPTFAQRLAAAFESA
jgi:peptidoglycan/xylan/chitin deacetylase (PgdA/CDA1 family)